MTPTESSQVHAKIFGQEIDLRGKAARSAPMFIALIALLLSGWLVLRFGNLETKVDKILFILAQE